jgi:hypothetical protein
MDSKFVLSLLHTAILLLVLIPCKGQIKIPTGFRKLTEEEVLQRVAKEEHPPQNVKILLENGFPFNNEAIMALSQKKLIGDQYVDSNKIVRLIILRKTTAADEKLLLAMERQSFKADTIQLLDIDCGNIKNILKSVYQNDQDARGVNATITENRDKQNQKIVLSMIKKCGFPTPPLVDRSDLETIFLVIQHGPKSMRAEYYKYFLELCNKKEFNKSMLVLMEDRMLMDIGEKQKYGTQVTNLGSNGWELYPVDNIDSVNKRRKTIGLEPVEQYINSFH